MNKKELALEVIERLKNEYPDADCTLEYDQAWKLLVSVRLAAQCHKLNPFIFFVSFILLS